MPKRRSTQEREEEVKESAKWKLDTTGISIGGIEMTEFKKWKLQNLKQE
ncbi:MAG TPA: hypothetical protein VIQ31_06365 [Phormidium sp.]